MQSTTAFHLAGVFIEYLSTKLTQAWIQLDGASYHAYQKFICISVGPSCQICLTSFVLTYQQYVNMTGPTIGFGP